MRPYWTILKDAFREAFASRVLWVLMLIITVVLISLAPLGYRLDLVTEFTVGEFRDARRFAAQLRDDAKDESPSPGRRIWTLFDAASQRELAAFADGKENRRSDYFQGARRLQNEMNTLLARRDFYVAADWEDVHFRKELRDLIERDVDTLSDRELARRNRLLIEAQYRSELEPRPREAVLFTYLGLDMTPTLPFSKQQVDALIEQVAITMLMNILLGWIAVIAGILVTAPIIPQMFQPGSLHLLLSKPISRSLLFITRVLGGCAFVVICITYLVVGLWLIAGTRFGLWNLGMLKCIPVFLFLFAIYYVVSAFIGAIWKNAVVAVLLTMGFSFLCNFLGWSKEILEGIFIEPQRIVNVVPAGDTIIAVDERGGTKQWNKTTRTWDDTFLGQGNLAGMVRVIGPIYDESNDRLLAVRLRGSPFSGFMLSGSKLQVGKREEGWRRQDGPALPRGAFALLQEPDGQLIAVGDDGVSRLAGTGESSDKPELNFFGFPIPLGGPTGFQKAGPDGMTIGSPATASINASNGNLAVCSEGTLSILKPNEKGRYERITSIELDGNRDEAVSLAYGGSTLLVARADGNLQLLDGDSLIAQKSLAPVQETQPRFLSASPNGRWIAIVYQDGQLWMLDTTNDEVARPNIDGQSDISAAVFSDETSLLVASQGTTVASYDPATLAEQQVWRPTVSRIEWVYRYVVMPIYTVFPKPGELNGTIQYLLTDEKTTDFGFLRGDMQAKREQLFPWRPVWSGAIFIAAVLFVACIYIERQEF